MTTNERPTFSTAIALLAYERTLDRLRTLNPRTKPRIAIAPLGRPSNVCGNPCCRPTATIARALPLCPNWRAV